MIKILGKNIQHSIGLGDVLTSYMGMAVDVITNDYEIITESLTSNKMIRIDGSSTSCSIGLSFLPNRPELTPGPFERCTRCRYRIPGIAYLPYPGKSRLPYPHSTYLPYPWYISVL